MGCFTPNLISRCLTHNSLLANLNCRSIRFHLAINARTLQVLKKLKAHHTKYKMEFFYEGKIGRGRELIKKLQSWQQWWWWWCCLAIQLIAALNNYQLELCFIESSSSRLKNPAEASTVKFFADFGEKFKMSLLRGKHYFSLDWAPERYLLFPKRTSLHLLG